jgi:hypothetical protein
MHFLYGSCVRAARGVIECGACEAILSYRPGRPE